MELAKYIACICEGSAEEAIIDILLENHLLIFEREEMLIIFNEGKYNEFKKSKKSPSDFCKSNLKMRDVKSYDYVKGYFEDPDVLICAIKKYHKISRVQKDEYTLLDLIRK